MGKTIEKSRRETRYGRFDGSYISNKERRTILKLSAQGIGIGHIASVLHLSYNQIIIKLESDLEFKEQAMQARNTAVWNRRVKWDNSVSRTVSEDCV